MMEFKFKIETPVHDKEISINTLFFKDLKLHSLTVSYYKTPFTNKESWETILDLVLKTGEIRNVLNA